MKKPQKPKLKKVLIWGSVIGVGVWGYTWAMNLPNQFSIGKLKYIKKEGKQLFFELPIINDSILSPQLLDFTEGVLKADGKELGEVFIDEPTTFTKHSTTILKIRVQYKPWAVLGELFQILIHNRWNDIHGQLIGTVHAKQFITFTYPLDLTL
jgi:hypothetical protein